MTAPPALPASSDAVRMTTGHDFEAGEGDTPESRVLRTRRTDRRFSLPDQETITRETTVVTDNADVAPAPATTVIETGGDQGGQPLGGAVIGGIAGVTAGAIVGGPVGAVVGGAIGAASGATAGAATGSTADDDKVVVVER
jgi:hypothetical protein